MKLLHRKLLRDLLHLRSQMVAIALVIACAVATVVTARILADSLALSQATYYAAYRFADVFANLKRAPDAVVARIAALPGVAQVATRIVFDVTLDIPGLPEPATGRLISVAEQRVPVLNDLHLRRGRYIEPGRRDEVIVSESLAEANRLEVGDHIGAILNGRWARLRIVGIALSPEYIYEIRATDIFPDNRHFGVLWMSRDAMGPAFSMDGAFNDVALRLLPEADERAVIAALDRLLLPYGGFGAYGRNDHVSHRFLTDEIRQNETFGRIMPAIFLGLAAFLLNILLSRLVSMQRDQIGILKAFGYAHGAIALHYVEFALVAVAAGSLLGVASGVWLGSLVHGMYVEFYRFPVFQVQLHPLVVPAAVGISGAAALAGALAAVRRAYLLPPAVAMRAEPPPNFRAGVLERLGLLRALPVSTRIIARNLARRPLRAALTAFGIALAVAILVLVGYFREALERIGEVQYRLVQREDASVVAHEVLARRARFDLGRLPGVMRVEPFRAVPVRLRSRHHSRRTVLLGFERESELRRLVGSDLRAVPLPAEGVVLTAMLADILEVGPGDAVQLEVLDGKRQKRSVLVAALVDEMVGLSAYMDHRALARLLGEELIVSGGWLNADSDLQPALYRELKRLPAVGGVSLRAEALRSFEKTVLQNLTIFTSVLVFFGVVAAISVVYNAARIGLSERGRELASLRVLGYTRGEIAYVLLGEQALLTLAAIPLGYAIGYRLCATMAGNLQWELIRFPLFLSTWTYTFAFTVVAAAAVASAWIVRRRLDRLDLVAVLKTRE